MKEIPLFCEEFKCFCEDKCCQACPANKSCTNLCENTRYKQKLLSSDEFLISELIRISQEKESFLAAVAAERIKELTSIKK